MNHLSVIKLAGPMPSAKEVPTIFMASDVLYHNVERVNWPESYPYKPQMEFAIAYTDEAILIHYRVEEQSVRAVAQHDQDRIWEDSCAEFFCQPADDGIYYNFECNCVGKLLLAAGPDRNERRRASENIMQSIDRWASLGSEPFDTRQESTVWELALCIPFSAFFLHDVNSLAGMSVRANVYKCGDLLPVPHFVSWNAINTEKPDFHCPDYFGTFEFA